MGFITYKQADSRWGRKNYNGSSTMATAGCGPTSCAMIIYGIDGKTTPLDTMKYMQKNGFAIRNNGTAWSGIPSCLKAFGLKDVQSVPDMAKCWELMSKGYVGVFLFRSGSRNGCVWTTSGHYIAVTDYKVQNGKHYIYTRDSGGRNHTGWYCYETQMRGLIPQIWLGKIESSEQTTGTYTGTFPSLPPKTAKIAVECAYAYGTSKSVYKYDGGKRKKAYTVALNKAFPNRKGWKYPKSRAGASCDVFAGAVLQNAGYKNAPHAMSKYVAWCKKNLKAVSTAKNGDILTRTNHIMVFLELKGKKYVANAHYQTLGGTYGIVEKVGSHTKIWRTDKLDAFTKGDTFTDVKYLQRFLNWYGDYGLKIDYDFGIKTEEAVKDFQSKEGLTVDGVFGSACLAKAKEVQK